MNKETTYSKPEMSVLEILEGGILCASGAKTGHLNEEWKQDEDYSIFNF